MRRPFVVLVALAVAGVTALPAQAAPPGPFMRVIVQLHDSVDSPTSVAEEVLGRHPGRPIALYEHALKGFAMELPAGAVFALSRDPRVVDITNDPVVTIAAETLPTGVDRVESDLVPWGDVNTTATHCPTGSDCADVDIAILDTGIELYHPDLNVYRATNCTVGFLFPSCQNAGDLFDRNGHGTHVAGTAAACDNEFGVVGPASCARLWSFKVLDDTGNGFLSWIIAGIDVATAYASEIDVVNMSLTGQFQNATFDQALANSVAAGIVYVVAAGNSSADASAFSPAHHDDMITVSAYADFDGMGGGYELDNSCYPSDTDDVFATFSNYGADVDIAAPGVCIYSTHLNDGYAYYAGTSMASPHAAGAAALYIAKHGRDVNGDSAVNGADVAALRSILQSEGLPQGHACSFTGGAADGFAEPMLFVNGTGPAFGGDGTCTMATGPSNTLPVASNDLGSTNEDAALNVAAPGVLGNDSDGDGDPLTAVLDTDVSNGALSLNPDGSYTYTPTADFNGSDSFTYRANDGTGNSNVATVDITVNPVNDDPIAVGDSYVTDEDTALSVAAPGVLGNDTDPDSDPLTAVLDTDVSNGALTLNVDGSYTYTPAADYNGPDSFTYHAYDGTTASATVTVSITVNSVNDPPTAFNDSQSIAEDTTLNVNSSIGVLLNDDDGGDGPAPLTAVLDTGPAYAAAFTLGSDGSYSYTPATDYSGVDSFTYYANDGADLSNVGTVTITVNPINDPPVATGDSYSTSEDTPLAAPAPGVLGNDTDVEGDSLTAVLDTDVSNGALTLNANGSFNYMPNGGYNGPDSFTYHAYDGNSPSNVVTVSIAVTPSNDPPVADNDAYSTSEDTTLNVGGSGVLVGDTDPDGDPLTAVLDTGPGDGVLSLNPDGSFSYTPDPDFNGTDSFSYRANDGIADSNLATVTITITAVNDVPSASGDAYATNEDTTLNIPADGVLGNDTDPDGDPLTAVLDADVSNGALILNVDGSFTYDPYAEFSGADSFTYHAYDGTTASNVVTVLITVNPVNDPPVADNDSYGTDEDVTLNVAAPGVLDGDSDPEGDPLTANLVATASNGNVTLNPDGSFTYTPNPDYNGPDSFTYRANDGTDDSNLATVNLTVNPINDPPVAVSEPYSLDQDTTLTVTAPGVLGNDTDPDGDPLTAVLDTDVSSGALTLNADGSFTYTPNPGYFGGDSFTYHATDGTAASATVTVTLIINEITPTTSPNLAYGFEAGVSTAGWTTITPGPTYTSMVVVATPNYDSSTVPLVVRVRNVTPTSFEASLARTAGTGTATADVYWMAVEEGVYTETEHGVKMEAHTFLSTVTDENNAWNGELRSYSQGYSTPVVMGQVMTTNDSDWSVFWSRGSGRNRPPNGTLRVGKHVGEDSDVTRANETIGYIIIEAGSGSIGGTPYLAAVGGDSIRGFTNSPPYNYSISGPAGATIAVVSQTGMDGNNGGWAVLYGANPVSASNLALAIDEDQSNDTERRHTSEQVAYIVFG